MNKSLKSQAYMEIKTRILRCEFKPGALLNETELCGLFSISRTPVRDALSRLEQDGLIQIFPPKGFLITPVTYDSIRNFFEVLLHIEPELIKTYGKTLPLQELQELFLFRKDYLSPSALTSHLLAFRQAVVGSSPNPYTHYLYEQLGNLEHRLLLLFPVSDGQLESLASLCRDTVVHCLREEWQDAALADADALTNYQKILTNAFLAAQKP